MSPDQQMSALSPRRPPRQIVQFVVLKPPVACLRVVATECSETSGDVWTIPASRMKTQEQHRVPPSSARASRVPAKAQPDSPGTLPPTWRR